MIRINMYNKIDIIENDLENIPQLKYSLLIDKIYSGTKKVLMKAARDELEEKLNINTPGPLGIFNLFNSDFFMKLSEVQCDTISEPKYPKLLLLKVSLITALFNNICFPRKDFFGSIPIIEGIFLHINMLKANIIYRQYNWGDDFITNKTLHGTSINSPFSFFSYNGLANKYIDKLKYNLEVQHLEYNISNNIRKTINDKRISYLKKILRGQFVIKKFNYNENEFVSSNFLSIVNTFLKSVETNKKTHILYVEKNTNHIVLKEISELSLGII
ncbi:virion protein [Glossina pallidipes salivary gland hypertrophy virus]|uniref:Virion protein n=1 Tax=Glossina hytrovirus (isolate Glossina pallidipes/Ethiopia/Seibersdorf/-) TaxID=379529 RepID=A0A125QZQ1_GHVS|nr:virion protein [Glossina pallidipes salivary gland hypertrophy virus]